MKCVALTFLIGQHAYHLSDISQHVVFSEQIDLSGHMWSVLVTGVSCEKKKTNTVCNKVIVTSDVFVRILKFELEYLQKVSLVKIPTFCVRFSILEITWVVLQSFIELLFKFHKFRMLLLVKKNTLQNNEHTVSMDY